MNQQPQPMTLPITVRYRWSADEVIQGLKVHLRRSSGVIWLVPYLGGFMVFCFIFVALSGKQSFASTFPGAMLGALFLFSNAFIRWQFRRRFQKNPNRGAQVTWVFSGEKFFSEGDGFDFSLIWEKVFQFIDSSRGFLIYPQKGLFYWIPFSAFSNESEIDCVRLIAKSKVMAYRKVG